MHFRWPPVRLWQSEPLFTRVLCRLLGPSFLVFSDSRQQQRTLARGQPSRIHRRLSSVVVVVVVIEAPFVQSVSQSPALSWVSRLSSARGRRALGIPSAPPIARSPIGLPLWILHSLLYPPKPPFPHPRTQEGRRARRIKSYSIDKELYLTLLYGGIAKERREKSVGLDVVGDDEAVAKKTGIIFGAPRSATFESASLFWS